jgi:hypothetical protein
LSRWLGRKPEYFMEPVDKALFLCTRTPRYFIVEKLRELEGLTETPRFDKICLHGLRLFLWWIAPFYQKPIFDLPTKFHPMKYTPRHPRRVLCKYDNYKSTNQKKP